MLTSVVVLLLNLATIRLSSKVNELRVAENRLIEYAKDFAYPPSSAKSADEVCCAIRTIDTKIPQSSVPLKHHIDDVYQDASFGKTNDKGAEAATSSSTYVIHGVEVQSKIQGGRKSRVPLVLLHGYMNGCLYFYRNLFGLGRYFDSIYSLDMLGWGLSSRPRFDALRDSSREMTEAFFVESLEAWRIAKGVDKMILAGHSMGGYISVAYTEKYPQHVERLILISPAGVPEQPQHSQQPHSERLENGKVMNHDSSMSSAFHDMGRRITKDIFTHVFHNYSLGDVIRSLPSSYVMKRVRDYVKRRFGDRIQMTPDEQDALSNYLYWNNVLPGSAEYCISRFLTPRVLFGQAPTVHRIPQLKVKSVAFLYGDNDWMDPVQGGWAVQRACLQKRQQERNKAAAPDVTVQTIPNAGHMLMLENWRDFNRNLVLAAGLVLLPEDMEEFQRSSSPLALSTYDGSDLFAHDTGFRHRVLRHFGTTSALAAHSSFLPPSE